MSEVSRFAITHIGNRITISGQKDRLFGIWINLTESMMYQSQVHCTLVPVTQQHSV